MNNGWIKLHRKFKDNPFYKDVKLKAVWIEMLLLANHKDYKTYWNGKVIIIKAGQFISTSKDIGEACGVNQKTVDKKRKTLKSEEQIEEQTTNRKTLFTINNWIDHQQVEEQVEEQRRNKGGTDEECIKQECKNEKNTTTENILKILNMSNRENLIPAVEELLNKHGEELVKRVAMKVSLKSGSTDARWLQFVNWCGSEKADVDEKPRRVTREERIKQFNKI